MAGAKPDATRIGSVRLACVLAVVCIAALGLCPGAAADGDGAPREHGERWNDVIHFIGLAGGLVGLLALVGGGYVYFTFAHHRAGFRRRLRARQLHMIAGLTGIGLAIGHAVGRNVQTRRIELELGSAQLTSLMFLLAGASGIIRHEMPDFPRNRPRIVVWVHRVAVVGLLLCLVLHGVHEYREYMAHMG